MCFNKKFLKTIMLSLSLMTGLLALLLMVFFYIFLPRITKHGQSVTVPNLKGMSIDSASALLTQRHLVFKITKDSTYSEAYPPFTILQQHPAVGRQVKAGRKIYITLNALTPPKVRMPNLVDGSIRNAQLVLKTYGLVLGKIKYVPDIAQNAVLKQFYNGKKIVENVWINKGTAIDLVVGAGLSNKTVKVPEVIGMHVEEATFLLLNAGLSVGSTVYKQADSLMAGTVFRQIPNAQENSKIGNTVDLWVVAFDDVAQSALLDSLYVDK